MKKSDVKIGGTYAAKVSDKVVPVRIDAENTHGGWDGTNQATGKKVRIKSAQRLRGPWPKETPASPPAAKAPAKATKVAKESPKRDTGQRHATPGKTKGLSCLDAAAEVLKRTGQPMNCKAMVEAMANLKLWTSDAATPAATLYSAILREMQKKGDKARFRKVERGLFELTK